MEPQFKTFTFSDGIDIKLSDASGRPMPEKSVAMHCWASYFSFHWDTVTNTSIMDIGAGDGTYSLLATKCGIAVDVHSFEVSPREFKLMEANIELNQSWFRSEDTVHGSSMCAHNHLPSKNIFNKSHLTKPLRLVRIATDYNGLNMLMNIEDLLREFRPTCFIHINSALEFPNIREIMEEIGYNTIRKINNKPKTFFESWTSEVIDTPNVIVPDDNIFIFKRI